MTPRPALAAIPLTLLLWGIHAIAEPDSVTPPGGRIEHVLSIVHPGDATAEPAEHTLVETRDQDGEPFAYSMWVDSVICRDEVCDVVKVQLHWDALGRYQRYQVAPGSRLTKLDHVPFTGEDRAKLQRILADPDSPLKEVEKEAMTAKPPPKPAKSSAAVDGVSGATVLTLKTAVILGAGYTCYDLWHWSNGLLTDHIRDFTGKNSSEEQLQAYLAKDDIESTLLALEYLGKRRISSPELTDMVIARSKDGDGILLVSALAYLRETAPSDQAYYDSIVSIFSATDSRKRLLILDVLSKESQQPVAGFYDRLCDYLPELESYYEVHLFLELMEKRNPASAVVAVKAAELLQHEKFFVSRRAYWYLEKRTLPANLRKLVDAYYDANKDRL
ncbi:MAG: hypothetical protein ACC661_04725 [Verrucomicrobiales bacterium]